MAERRLAERAQEQAYAEAVAAEEAMGRRVVESPRAGSNRPLRDLGFSEEAHQSEACHAVAVERRWRDVEVIPVCTDPRRHTTKSRVKDRTELQVAPTTVAGRSPEDTQRRAERKAGGQAAWRVPG